MQMIPDLPREKGAPNDEPEYVKLCRAQEDSKTRDGFGTLAQRAPNELR